MTTLLHPDHEWLRIEGDVATIGVTTMHSRSSATSCSLNCPRSAAAWKKAEAAAVVESVKAASDVHAPISGEVTEVNDALAAEPARQFRCRRQGLVLQGEDRGQSRLAA